MPRPIRGAVTIEDVADAAGVSRATASRALSGSPAVTDPTRAKVRAAADRLGYVVNATARALATGGGHRVAVAVVGEGSDVLEDAYVGRVIGAAARRCGPAGLGVSLHWLPLGGSRLLDRMARDRSVQGIVLVNTTRELLAAIPTRLRGRVASIGVGSPVAASFDVDNATSVRAVLRHMYESGRRRIAMVTGPEWLPCTRRPVRAYRRAMAEMGLESRVAPGHFSAVSGRAAASMVLRSWPDTDAVYAICDATALGVIGALRDRDIVVPDDIAVAGFDDIPFAELSTPSLTTASHPVERIAAGAVSAVLDGAATVDATTWFRSEAVLRQSA